uniref:Uncharacterized protein n=1 Tax=Arundo donax TaxID=35708 RepID=A0A0A8YII0_ARUDO
MFACDNPKSASSHSDIQINVHIHTTFPPLHKY